MSATVTSFPMLTIFGKTSGSTSDAAAEPQMPQIQERQGHSISVKSV